MSSASPSLLGLWTVELVDRYFAKQKAANGEQLFVKITGMDDESWPGVLEAFRTEKSRLSQSFQLEMRTLGHVDAFPEYARRLHETSTWLRNNTPKNVALLLFMNEATSEAQSLENLFTIDEAKLLGAEGLDALFGLLADKYRLYGDERGTLQKFIIQYETLGTPQLRAMVAFLTSLVEDAEPSMIDKIQKHLDKLQLFRDPKWTLKTEGSVRLKRNFQLSRLERDGRSIKKEELVDNLYEFINKSDPSALGHELWDAVDPDTFLQQALAFIHRKSADLLQYDFEIIEEALWHRKRNGTLKDRLQTFKASVESEAQLTKERAVIFEDALEAIQEKKNPDALQDLLDECAPELQSEPKLSKELQRLVIRLRQLAEYTELDEALLQESLLMMDEVLADRTDTLSNPAFVLRLEQSSINEEEEAFLRFHLLELEKLTDHIRFEASSLPAATSEKQSGDEWSFHLTLSEDGKSLHESRFKLRCPEGNALVKLIDSFAETGSLPYVKQYRDTDTKPIDLRNSLHERVGGYIATGNVAIKEAADALCAFLDFFSGMASSAIKNGMCSLDFTVFESQLENLLTQADSSVLLVQQVYSHLSMVGTIDHHDGKPGDGVNPVTAREVTLLNPLRLLSYAKKLARIPAEHRKWNHERSQSLMGPEDTKAYLQQLRQEKVRLAPHYFAIDGMSDRFLIEQEETWGEGTFVLNGESGTDGQLVDTFAEEFLSTVRTYLEVYPYARDCLDLVFLYCSHADYVTKAIEQLFRHTDVRKVKAVVHSASQGAAIYKVLNGWADRDERYAERYYRFPKVEIQVVAAQSVNEMMEGVRRALLDADIGVLVQYFGQTSHVQCKLEKVPVRSSDDWFDTVFKEPARTDESVKKVSYVSENLPPLLQAFYRMQYMLSSGHAAPPDEHYLLRDVISIGSLVDRGLLDFMHEQFNWSLFLDRYLDKSLLQKVSAKAQIIKYKTKTGHNKRMRTLVSSSEYIRKLTNQEKDLNYYDRLYQKFAKLLKNEQISRQIVIEATEKVKNVSGGIVLRAIGPGKFAHEMLAMYLAMQARPTEAGELVNWAVCDELPWFQGGKRRPDLVRTSLRTEGTSIAICFELIELKFVSHTIFEAERADAISQVRAGLNVYKANFDFPNHPASAEIWRQELVDYLLEAGTYSVEEAHLLKRLQNIPICEISTSFKGAVDSFVYTSNLLEYPVIVQGNGGYGQEWLNAECLNHIYNRSFILRSLGEIGEASVPGYEELEAPAAYVTEKLGIPLPPPDDEEALSASDMEKQIAKIAEPPHIVTERAITDTSEIFTCVIETGTQTAVLQVVEEARAEAAASTEDRSIALSRSSDEAAYPEIEALAGEPHSPVERPEDMKELLDSYQRKLRFNFQQFDINVKVVDSFVGVSVIRLVLDIPVGKTVSAIENRSREMQLWLGLSTPPHVTIGAGKINLDINRDQPETVYFETFMGLARERYPAEKRKGKLIAPLGLGQLRELVAMDFSSSNTPHLLIGGTTGSGKSVTINSIILAMMCLYSPDEVQFVFIDPKKVEFMVYENLLHTKQVLTEIEPAIEALEQLVGEMEERYRLFAGEKVRSIDEYVEVTGTALPRLVVVFDEFADFMEREKSFSSRVETAIQLLGQKARAAGIHLLICTQNPKADIVPTNIRNNLPARLALKAADHHASKIIINEEGAERLGGKGDFLVRLDGPTLVRAKSPYLTARVTRKLLLYFQSPKG